MYNACGCSPTHASLRARPLQSFADVHPAAEAERRAAEQPVRQSQTQSWPGGSADSAGRCAVTGGAAAGLSAATDAWAVVEHALRSWPRDAALLLLGTCHVPLSTLPAPVSRRFGSGIEQVPIV
jgi:hypothetical protein